MTLEKSKNEIVEFDVSVDNNIIEIYDNYIIHKFNVYNH